MLLVSIVYWTLLSSKSGNLLWRYFHISRLL